MKFFSAEPALSSYRIRIGYSYAYVEVRSQNPVLVRFHNFLSKTEVSNILEYQENKKLESMKLFGPESDITTDARIADGNHVDKVHSGFQKIINRLQRFLKVNLKTSEGLLVSFIISLIFFDFSKPNINPYFLSGDKWFLFLFLKNNFKCFIFKQMILDF